MTIRERLASNLKAVRLAQGYTRGTMASALDCPRTCYNGYENGQTKTPHEVLLAVQIRFGIGLDVFYTADLSTVRKWEWRGMVAASVPRMPAALPVKH